MRRRRRTRGRAMRTASRSGSGGGRTTPPCSPPRRPRPCGWRALPFICICRGAAADRRGAARGPAAGGGPGPDRPRVLQLDAPVGGRAGADRRLRRRLARGGRAGGRGVGAVLALPAARSLRRAAGRPVRPGGPGAGAGAALLAAGVPADRDAEPGGPLPRHRGGPDQHRAAGQLAPVRPGRAARRRCSAARSGPARPPASCSRRRSGARPAGRWSPPCSRAACGSGRGWRRSSGRPCSPSAWTTSPGWSRCSASPSTTGARSPAAAPSPSGAPAASALEQGGDLIGPRRTERRSGDRGHQVVGAIGAGGLEVEAGAAVGQRHGADVAQGAVTRPARSRSARRPG